MAEIVVRGDMLPSLREWAARQGFLFQPLPSEGDSHYHSFMLMEPRIPEDAIEGLTPEQIAEYNERIIEVFGKGPA